MYAPQVFQALGRFDFAQALGRINRQLFGGSLIS
jgi:hypothetical protein